MEKPDIRPLFRYRMLAGFCLRCGKPFKFWANPRLKEIRSPCCDAIFPVDWAKKEVKP